MAKNKIAIEIDVNSEDGAKSIKQLKQEFKDLQKELEGVASGSEKYTETLKKLANVKDEIDDLNDAISAQTGAGRFQALANVGSQIAAGFSLAQGAMALFGTESQEVEKILLKVQAAQAILAGFKELEGLQDALVNAGQAAKALWAIIAANPLTAVVTALVAITAASTALYYAFKNQNTEVSKLKAEYDQLKKSTEILTETYDIQIKSLEGLKKNEQEILALQEKKLIMQITLAKKNAEIAKAEAQQAIDKATGKNEENNLIEKGIKLFSNAAAAEVYHKNNIVEANKALDAANKATRDLLMSQAELQAFRNAQEQKRIDDAAKNKKTPDEIAFEKHKKMWAEEETLNAIHVDKVASDVIASEELKQMAYVDTAELQKKLDEEKQARDERNRQFAINSTLQGLQVIQDLTTAFAGKSEEQQRRAFNINKAAQIAEATISAILSSQKAFTSQIIPGDPTSPVRGAIAAALAAAAGVARVAAIAKTQFNSTGGGGSIAGGGGSFSGGGTFTPTLNNPTGNTSTILSNIGNGTNQGNQNPVKVYVTETDISNAQNNVQKIKSKALIE